MKKRSVLFLMVVVFFVAGCSDKSTDKENSLNVDEVIIHHDNDSNAIFDTKILYDSNTFVEVQDTSPDTHTQVIEIDITIQDETEIIDEDTIVNNCSGNKKCENDNIMVCDNNKWIILEDCSLKGLVCHDLGENIAECIKNDENDPCLNKECGQIDGKSCGSCEDDSLCENNQCVQKPCPDSNFPRHHNGTCWSERVLERMNWSQAIEHCSNLGGKLPSISELRTLIKNCPDAETGGPCGISDECLSIECFTDACRSCRNYDYSVFGDAEWFWSSSAVIGANIDGVWGVEFKDANVNMNYASSEYRFICISQ